ncbi:hypothetical protein CHRYSEOSP005_17090 [Chryseobacterium sp. Alg-005]
MEDKKGPIPQIHPPSVDEISANMPNESKCDLIAESDDTFLFDMILTDKKYDARYPITVSVIKNQSSFRIEDIFQEVSVSN